jgi:hypothetical protein
MFRPYKFSELGNSELSISVVNYTTTATRDTKILNTDWKNCIKLSKFGLRQITDNSVFLSCFLSIKSCTLD